MKKIGRLFLTMICMASLNAQAGEAVDGPLLDKAYTPIETMGTTCDDQEKLFLRLADETAHQKITKSSYVGTVVSTSVIRSLMKQAADTKDRKLADFTVYLVTSWTTATDRFLMSPLQSASALSAWCRLFEGRVPLVFVPTDAKLDQAFARGAQQCIGPIAKSRPCFQKILEEEVK